MVRFLLGVLDAKCNASVNLPPSGRQVSTVVSVRRTDITAVLWKGDHFKY